MGVEASRTASVSVFLLLVGSVLVLVLSGLAVFTGLGEICLSVPLVLLGQMGAQTGFNGTTCLAPELQRLLGSKPGPASLTWLPSSDTRREMLREPR